MRVIFAIVFAVILTSPCCAAIVAIGYDFKVDAGSPLVKSVTLPNVGDGVYDLFLGSPLADTGTNLAANVEFFFSPSVSEFGIRGIETSAMLDPNDPLAFACPSFVA